jgi:hypothetical protein
LHHISLDAAEQKLQQRTAENKGGTLEVTLGTQKGAITSVDLQGPAQVLRIFEI